MVLGWEPVAAAQFSLFMAISNVGLMTGSALMGPLVALLTDAQALFATAAMPAVAALLLLRVDVAAHVARVETLGAPSPAAGAADLVTA